MLCSSCAAAVQQLCSSMLWSSSCGAQQPWQQPWQQQWQHHTRLRTAACPGLRPDLLPFGLLLLLYGACRLCLRAACRDVHTCSARMG